jgi:DNA-binding transcriptional LysR family regulator
MNERQLRYALAVRDERGFSRAARRLNVSQPSVSQQVRVLEEELGFALFARTPRGVEATFLGRKFLDQTEQAMTRLTGLADVARRLRRGPTRGLAVGISSGIAPFVIPLVIEALGKELAHLRLELATAPSPHIQRQILHGALGLGIIVEISASHLLPELKREALGTVEMAVFVAPGHKLLRRPGKIDLAEIVDEPFVITEPNTGYGELVQSIFSDRGLVPNVVAISDTVGAAKLMVRSGIGIAILPAVCSPSELAAGELFRIPLATPRLISIDMAFRPGLEDSLIKSSGTAIAGLLRKRLKSTGAMRSVA